MRKRIVIVGAGGHAQVIADLIAERQKLGEEIELAGFLDDNPTVLNVRFSSGERLGSLDALKSVQCDGVVIGIGDNGTRQRLFIEARNCGHRLVTLVHPRAVVSSTTEIGEGTVIFGGAVVNTGSVIGENVIVNTGATVDHHNIIGRHAHIGPGAHLGGTVTVSEGTFLGIGVSVLPNITIGSWSMVGAGAVVTKNLRDHVTAVGVPARIIKDLAPATPAVVTAPPEEPVASETELIGARPTLSTAKNARCSSLSVVDVEDQQRWDAVIERCQQRDFYFLARYNALEKTRTGNRAELWVYEENGFLIALPLLFRSIGANGVIAPSDSYLHDCSSVYGYAGPTANVPDVPRQVSLNFQKSIEEELRRRSVVSVFARFHPLLSQEQLVADSGLLLLNGRTVSIDLTLGENDQTAQYRRNHARDIRMLYRRGAEVVVDETCEHIATFEQIYAETMERVSANAEYAFDSAYFEGLKNLGCAKTRLVFCSLDGELIAGGMMIECNGILGYHLGGTRNDYLRYSPMKLVIDASRTLGSSLGLRVFHLGGGVGAMEDSLFTFKAGFSDRRHEFLTWRWIVDPDRYHELCVLNSQQKEPPLTEDPGLGFFPAYRDPGSASHNEHELSLVK